MVKRDSKNASESNRFPRDLSMRYTYWTLSIIGFPSSGRVQHAHHLGSIKGQQTSIGHPDHEGLVSIYVKGIGVEIPVQLDFDCIVLFKLDVHQKSGSGLQTVSRIVVNKFIKLFHYSLSNLIDGRDFYSFNKGHNINYLGVNSYIQVYLVKK